MENPAVVIDNGSGICKVGFSNEKYPTACFPAIVGTIRKSSNIMEAEDKTLYVGCEARTKTGIMSLKYPIQRSIIEDWDSMEKIWEHCF